MSVNVFYPHLLLVQLLFCFSLCITAGNKGSPHSFLNTTRTHPLVLFPPPTNLLWHRTLPLSPTQDPPSPMLPVAPHCTQPSLWSGTLDSL